MRKNNLIIELMKCQKFNPFNAIDENILCLDLGRNIGFCYIGKDVQVSGSCERDLKDMCPTEKCGEICERTHNFIEEFIRNDERRIETIYYEHCKGWEAKNGEMYAEAYWWASFSGMSISCMKHKIKTVPLTQLTIKKCWCGDGSADKKKMINEAMNILPEEYAPIDINDNELDAIAIASYAIKSMHYKQLSETARNGKRIF